jgi:hypothetical protein
LDDWIYFTHTLSSYLQVSIRLSTISILYKSLGHAKSSQSSLVISWQRIYNSLTVTTAHIKPSNYALIPFLPSLLNHLRLPSQETPSILIPSALDPRYITSGRIQQKTPFPSLWPNNTSIVAYVFVAAGTCLTSRCLAINVYSGSAIPAFMRNVTILFSPSTPRYTERYVYITSPWPASWTADHSYSRWNRWKSVMWMENVLKKRKQISPMSS